MRSNKMTFFDLWNETRKNGINQDSFFTDFLSGSEQSLKPLFLGTKDELFCFCNLMLDIPVDEFINYVVNKNFCLKPEDIIQFSDFEHAVFDVNRIIKLENKDMTFTEIGKEIMNCKLEGACKKYGENHSKLASQLSLVRVERNGCFFVSNTNFGSYSVSLSKEDKIEIIKRLALRNIFIQKIISDAKNGNCDYQLLAESVLSTSTAIRRKSNVRYLVTLILSHTGNEYLLKNIVW